MQALLHSKKSKILYAYITKALCIQYLHVVCPYAVEEQNRLTNIVQLQWR